MQIPLGIDHPTTKPVNLLEADSTSDPVTGRALCLSGGGYRAMVFHLGVLWRLHDAGWLGRIDRISSVSGGSITAACLALQWSNLFAEKENSSARFRDLVVDPIRKVAGTTIDVGAVLRGLLFPWTTIGERVAASYRSLIFGDQTLQDIPEHPLFVFNATSLRSGALCRFMKLGVRDWRIGELKQPKIPLSHVVAASSAFPPFLSPLRFQLKPGDITAGTGADLQYEPYTRELFLTDGGVYDNLGLETAWKSCRTILVSDAGAKMAAQPYPKIDWLRHLLRVLDVVDNQVRSLRKRELIDAFQVGRREGAYWGIRTDITAYGLNDPLPCSRERAEELAAIPTRLKALDPTTQDRLINWGYAICDAALRKHVDTTLPPPQAFPYPNSGV